MGFYNLAFKLGREESPIVSYIFVFEYNMACPLAIMHPKYRATLRIVAAVVGLKHALSSPNN